jgi:hypothetical protein
MEGLGGKSVPVSVCPTQVPHGQACYRTPSSPVYVNEVVFRGRKNTSSYALNGNHLFQKAHQVVYRKI